MHGIPTNTSAYFTKPNAAYDRLLDDYVRFHAVLAIVGGMFTLLIFFLGVWAVRRFRTASRVNGRRWTFEGKTYFSFAALGILVGLLLAVVVAANISTVLKPQPGLAGSAGGFQTGPLSHAYHAWLQSGNAHLPSAIQSKVNGRLAWQRPKAIITGILLAAFAGLTGYIWRSLITQPKAGTAPGRSKRTLLLTSGGISAVACFLLMLMVMGNTQAAIAPISLTLLYG